MFIECAGYISLRLEDARRS